MYVYCTLGLPTAEYDAHDIIIGSADGIINSYDYSAEELQSAADFTDGRFREFCTEYLGTDMSELFAEGSALPAVTKSIALADPANYGAEEIAEVLNGLLGEYFAALRVS